MFKFTTFCLMAVFTSTFAAPAYLSSLGAYSSAQPLGYGAPIGYGAQYVAPYAASYNAHQIDHSVAYPAYQFASPAAPAAAYAAPAGYAAAPAVYGASPLGYPFQSAYATHPAYAQQAYAANLYK